MSACQVCCLQDKHQPAPFAPSSSPHLAPYCCCLGALTPHLPFLQTFSFCRREAFVVPFITGTVPAWSDACFCPVQWDSPPKCDGEQGWQVVCSAATDAEGWIYGTTFDHLQYERPGGRASKRVNDRVRSRLWRRVQQQQQVRNKLLQNSTPKQQPMFLQKSRGERSSMSAAAV
jgi:hypothetical protein